MEPKVKIPRYQYDKANIQRAFDATRTGMSVYKAARVYNVPESTLRDRTRGYVLVNAKPGTGTLLNKSEENELVNHIKYMADIGYGYNKSEIQYMARDFAISLGKPVKSTQHMSNAWFYDFLARWPDLKIATPQKLSISRAKAASEENIKQYFKELGTIISVNNLSVHPERIYNVDETGVSTEHTPSRVVCRKDSIAQYVTSPRSSNVTIIAGGNALGHYIPPYYVFPGKRWSNDLLNNAAPGSYGEMTKNGWSNSTVFTNYLQKHFIKFVNLAKGTDGMKTLILYDGHRSHILLTLTQWAKKNNVILFVLPPHSSHLTQPLDVGIFGPFKSMYNSECHSYMKKNPGLTISRYNLAELTAGPYIKAMRPENLISAFHKAGIHPFNCKMITPAQLAPAVIYTTEPEEPSQVETAQPKTSENLVHSTIQTPASFFSQRTITTTAPNMKLKRKFVPPFLAGNLLKKSNQEIIQASAAKKSANEENLKKMKQNCTLKKSQANKNINPKTNKIVIVDTIQNPVPCTSGLNVTGGPIDLSPPFSESDTELEDDEDVCCVCQGWQPVELRQCQTLCFVKWGKCDFCDHWTHLKYCCDVTVLRRDSIFRCPHCPSQEE